MARRSSSAGEVMGVRLRSPLFGLVLSLVFLVFLGAPARARAEGEGRTCTPAQVDQVTADARGEIMAPCCWKNTLLHHSSPQADQMSAEVRRMAEGCATKQEILDAFVAQHGETILARPRRSGLGLWFYLGPALGLLLTGLWIWRRVLPRLATPVTAPASPVPAAPAPEADPELARRFEAEMDRLRG